MPMKFWMVWLNDSPTTKHRHTTYEAACYEASRIARLNVGKKVYVLEAVEYRSVDLSPVSVTIL